LAEFKAKADQAKHDLALEAVLEERAAGARKTSPRPKWECASDRPPRRECSPL